MTRWWTPAEGAGQRVASSSGQAETADPHSAHHNSVKVQELDTIFIIQHKSSGVKKDDFYFMSRCPNSVQLGLVTDKPYHWLQGSLRLWISYFGHSLHLLCPFHHHQLCFLIYILVFFIIFFFRERFFQELRTPVSQDFPFYSDNFTVWLVFTPTLSTWWSSSAHSKINFLLSSRLRSVRGSELTGSFWLHPSPTTTYCHTVLAPLRHNRLLQWLLLLCGHTFKLYGHKEKNWSVWSPK